MNLEGVLKENMENGKVFFFSKEGCTYCGLLENDLKEYNISYKKIMITSVEDSLILKTLTGLNTYPMVYFGKNQIGGYNEFLSLCLTNELEKKLNESNIKTDGINY